VIIPDVNVLLYAYDTDAPEHVPARAWWETALGDSRPVGLPWMVALGFLRIATNRRANDHPLTPEVACSHVESWLAQPQVFLLHPGQRHAMVLFDLVRRLGTAGNLTSDAHLAALAIEHQAEIFSTDADFSRFPGLRWTNPLAE